jgi:thiol-disulfide isomerase/thioredoxin
MRPLVEGLKQKNPNVEFRLLNVDGSDQSAISLADKLGAQYVPTFVFVTKDGVVSGQLVGEQTSDALQQALSKLK